MSLTPEFITSCVNQKILIIEPFFNTPHVETGLELAEVLSAANAVTYLGPDILRCTTDESSKLSTRALNTLSRKRHVSNFLCKAAHKFTRGQLNQLLATQSIPDPRDLIARHFADLRDIRYENFDLGMGILSSLLSITRDINVDPARHQRFTMKLAADALKLFVVTKALIVQTQCDFVVLFNGRMAPVRAIRRACEATGTRYIVHERGSSADKYALFDCSTPHMPEGYKRWVDDWWAFSDTPETQARQYLERRRKGAATNWYSFIGQQEKGLVPVRDARKRITFFTSSEDELAAIGDDLKADNPLCNQAYAIRQVGASCRQKNYEYIVRFHPNTPETASQLTEAARQTSSQFYDASSNVDTYALIDSSDIVFTQNSTVGIEAAASGKPAFYTGRNIFEGCGSVKRITNETGIGEALETCSAPDPMDALKYANFLANHGISYQHFTPSGILTGTFKGYDLNAPFSALRAAKLRLTRGGV